MLLSPESRAPDMENYQPDFRFKVVYSVLSWRSSASEQPVSTLKDFSAALIDLAVPVLTAPRVIRCRSWALSMVWLEGGQ